MTPTGFTLDYNANDSAFRLHPDDGTFEFILTHRAGADSHAGARLSSVVAYPKARLSAELKVPLLSGNVFALYCSTLEPAPGAAREQDELDWEFLRADANHVWTNMHKGGEELAGEMTDIGCSYADGEWHEFVLEWDVEAGLASWTVDGRLVRHVDCIKGFDQ
eukprot:TRINITY_DN57318_c1_g1_i1.p2 TRINITY_DN57318_c1_g1~~TRINITY_DN57318_c1_g1_i1.p2  ORF type:complete len:163 (+),score=24.99 TRINITY_DN57318_c1_g1_i1:36-524(+)